MTDARTSDLTATFFILCFCVLAACDGGIVASDGRIYPGGQYFGEHLALDGDYLLASAWGSDDAFVLRRSTGGWSVEGNLAPPGGSVEGNFGWSVALRGDVAAVGSPVLGGERGGAVYVYERSGSEWTQAAALAPPSPLQTDRWFGEAVSISDDLLAVTLGPVTRDLDTELVDSAAVVFYERRPDGWAEAGRISEPAFEHATAYAGSGFGSALDLDENRLAVSSPGEDFGGVRDAGVVRIYERSGSEWNLRAEVQPDDPVVNSGIGGTALDLDGSTLAVTAASQDDQGRTAGRVIIVFRETGGAWVQEAVLRPADLLRSDGYGWTLDVDGARLAVSAVGRAGFRGSAFVFARTPSGTWELEAEVWPESLGEDALFSEDVALDGGRLLGGAAGVGGEEGGVFEFRREGTDWVEAK